jgi:hypothetical protein
MSTDREKFIDIITRIGEGNVGGMQVMLKISKAMPPEAFGYLVGALEDHKIFGPKLWLAYKDYAKENIDTMATGILMHSPELRDAIRAVYPDWDWAI